MKCEIDYDIFNGEKFRIICTEKFIEIEEKLGELMYLCVAMVNRKYIPVLMKVLERLEDKGVTNHEEVNVKKTNKHIVEIDNRKYVVYENEGNVLVVDDHGNKLFDIINISKKDLELLFKIWKKVKERKVV